MGLFEKVAVVDFKLRLSLAVGVIPFVASVFVGTAVIGEEWAFWAGTVIGIVIWLLTASFVYRRLPS